MICMIIIKQLETIGNNWKVQVHEKKEKYQVLTFLRKLIKINLFFNICIMSQLHIFS